MNDLKKELKEKNNISKQKDDEILLLVEEINSIRKTISNPDVDISQDNLINYINKIKKEKGMIDNEQNDENIQVDFSDNEDNDDNEE